MTLKFIDLYNECAGQPWSMFDADAESIDDLESALKISINKATSYLWNLQPWSFRYATQALTLRADKSSYTVPNGLILTKTINKENKYSVKLDGKFLDYYDDIETREEKTGTPEGFYVEGESIIFYPIPNDDYKVTVKYLLLPFALSDDGDEIYEMTEDDDYINIPEKYEAMFKNCLISLAMMYAIADPADENYPGYETQYNNALQVLISYCNSKLNDKSISW